jgi:hypothetical protein
MSHLFSVAEHFKALALGREEEQSITLQLTYEDVVTLTNIIQDATNWFLEKGEGELDWDGDALVDTILSARAFMEQELGCEDNG